MNNTVDGKAPLIYFVPFAITFMDSAFAYFAHPLGFTLTANAAVPFILLYFGVCNYQALRLPQSTLVWLGVLIGSFCLAVLTANDMSFHRIPESVSCMASFYSGYLLWRRAADSNQLARWLIWLSLVYVVICLVALSYRYPAHFPVNIHYWSQDGLAQGRPMVTADSNMQFYYVFPAALALLLPFRLFRTTLAAVVVVGGLYVLAQLQTRSGSLSYAGVLVLVLLAPLWNKELGRAKMLLYPLVALAAVITFRPIVQHAFELLLYRLNEPDMASGNGRVGSTLYIFNHLLDPYWWIPRGADEFLHRYGGLPHSNLTAVFLDGGMAGMLAWIALVVAPIVQGCALLFRRRLDGACIMALIGAIGVLMVQLSLHNPLRDQIWLWAGALIGALTRVRMQATSQVTSAAPEQGVPTALRVDAAGIINSTDTCLSSASLRRLG